MPLLMSQPSSSDNILSTSDTAWIDGLCRRWNIPGLSVSVVSDNAAQVVPIGITNPQGDPFTHDSLFCIASCSKLFTAYAIGLLVAEKTVLPNGKQLAWDTKLVDILDDWDLSDRYITDHVDLIDLLSMRWGLPGHDRILNSQAPTAIIEQLSELPFSAELRQIRQYSNIAYIVASEVVTRLSASPFTAFVESRIFAELGMDSSTYRPHEGRVMGSVHGSANRTQFYRWNLHEHQENNAGAGGIWSTAEDMVKWLFEMVNPTLLPTQARAAIFSPSSIPFSTAVNPETGFWTYGLGTYVLTYRSHTAYYHAGMVPGQYSHQLVLPDLGKAIMVFSNDDTHGSAVNKVVAYSLMDAMLGLDVKVGDWESRVLGHLVQDPSEGHAGTSHSHNTEKGSLAQWAHKMEPPTDVSSRLIGTYRHPSYPDMSISVLPTNSPIRANFPAIQSQTSTPLRLASSSDDHMVFVAFPESMFVDTVLFVHKGGDIYTWIATKLYDEIASNGERSGKRVAPFIDGHGSCALKQKNAGLCLGMSGDWWVSGGRRSGTIEDDDVDEQVEVWFASVYS